MEKNNSTKKTGNADLKHFELEININGEKQKLLVPVESYNRRISIPIYIVTNGVDQYDISNVIRLIDLPESTKNNHCIQVAYYKTLYSYEELFDQISYRKIISRRACKVIFDKVVRKFETRRCKDLSTIDVMVKSI